MFIHFILRCVLGGVGGGGGKQDSMDFLKVVKLEVLKDLFQYGKLGLGRRGGRKTKKIQNDFFYQTKLLNIDVKGVWNRSETAWHQSVVSRPGFQITSTSKVCSGKVF